MTSEKEKLAGLDAEIHDLTACAQKLKDKGSKCTSLGPESRDSCRMSAITANGKPGIMITGERARHIEMLMYDVK
jgi:hypothetical protein